MLSFEIVVVQTCNGYCHSPKTVVKHRNRVNIQNTHGAKFAITQDYLIEYVLYTPLPWKWTIFNEYSIIYW